MDRGRRPAVLPNEQQDEFQGAFERGREQMREDIVQVINGLNTLQGIGANTLLYKHEVLAAIRKIGS